jgi:SAM-dependent methyltransferase
MDLTPQETPSLFERFIRGFRCPDCRSTRVSADPQAVESQHQNGTLDCLDCGRHIPIRERLFDALPVFLDAGRSANRDLYDDMASKETNALSWRATTRNHRTKHELVSSALGLDAARSPQLILEMGVGYGANGVHFTQRGHLWVGVDISPGLLREAARHYPELAQAPRVASDATGMPFLDGLFDGVFCVATLHHLPEPHKGIAEALRVLRPGGRFCFIEPRCLYPTTVIQYLRSPGTEVSVWKVRASRVAEWARECGGQDVKVLRRVFTPNRPRVLSPLYDAIDRFCTSHPPLDQLAVVFAVQGVKGGGQTCRDT